MTRRRRVHIDDPNDRQFWIEGRRERVDLVQEAGWGQVSWWSVAAGALTAIGAFVLFAGVAAAVLFPIGLDLDGLSDSSWRSLGIGAGLGAAGALLAAFAFGGYAAGRMARRVGVRHGVLVFVAGLVVLAAAAGIAQLEGALSAIRERVESIGAPTGGGTWGGVAVVTGAAAIAGMAIGSLLGGLRGERWHQRLIARALDPDVGPDADLRADAEAQSRAAAEALERAQKAGALDGDVEPEPASADAEPTETEPAPTRAGRGTPPS
jgi:hypothetical protein